MNKDLTQGKPAKVLWLFCLPILISAVFQQFYNMADSIIAGKVLGENALAAVGASYPLTTIFIAVAFGFNLGCSAVVSKLFGEKNYRDLRAGVSTVMIASAVFDVLDATPLHLMTLLTPTPKRRPQGTTVPRVVTTSTFFNRG